MQPAATHLAIFGAGLSGLSSAWRLSRRFPAACVHLIERQHALGGWVHSNRIYLPNKDHSVLLESGPRTLRPNAQSILELIHLLNLHDQLITTPTSSPAAKSRFLKLTQGQQGLVTIPSSPWDVLRSPLRKIMLTAVMAEPFKKYNRPQGITDESLDSFMTRRFGSEFARVFGSALVHGIYATDSRKLSVRAAFPTLWEAEERGNGSLLRGILRRRKAAADAKDNYDLGTVQESMKDVSVYAFKDGISTLTSALEQSLLSTPNVVIHRGTSVTSFTKSPDSDQTFKISLSDGTIIPATHIVSTLPLPALHSILSKTASHLPSIPHLMHNPYTSVSVLNLVFDAPPSAIHPAGFGYLIPRPKEGYPTPGSPSLDSLGILGTVFDSSSLSAQDSSSEITKLTVMLGGPYATKPLPTTTSTMAPVSLIQPILAHLRSSFEPYVSTPLPDPVYWQIKQNQHCIPTYLPGHLDRMKEMKEVLKGEGWEGRMEVIGAGVGGVSVGDCIEAGRNVGEGWM